MNTSILADSIVFESITLEFANGTEVTFWKDSIAHMSIQVESTDDKLWIYVTASGTWYHNYD